MRKSHFWDFSFLIIIKNVAPSKQGFETDAYIKLAQEN